MPQKKSKARVPVRMYMTRMNPRSNDFNTEPETIEVSYFVWEQKGNKCLVNRSGWNGPKYRHWVNASDLHFLPPKEKEDNNA